MSCFVMTLKYTEYVSNVKKLKNEIKSITVGI